MIDKILADQYRRAGYFETGLIQPDSEGLSESSTFGREFPRSDFPFNSSSSRAVGNDQVFMAGQGFDIIAPIGSWPYMS